MWLIIVENPAPTLPMWHLKGNSTFASFWEGQTRGYCPFLTFSSHQQRFIIDIYKLKSIGDNLIYIIFFIHTTRNALLFFLFIELKKKKSTSTQIYPLLIKHSPKNIILFMQVLAAPKIVLLFIYMFFVFLNKIMKKKN